MQADLSSLSGAVMGAASALGYSVSGNGKRWPAMDRTRRVVEVPLEAFLPQSQGLRRQLQLWLRQDDLEVAFDHDAASRCVLRLSGDARRGFALTSAANELAGRIYQHAAYHRMVIALREWESIIIERTEGPGNGVTIHARLPARYQARNTSRTAHPDFGVRIDDTGQVEVYSMRLTRQGGQVLESFVKDVFGNEACAPRAEAAPERPDVPVPAGAVKVHAA
jgi:hypothetical protein